MVIQQKLKYTENNSKEISNIFLTFPLVEGVFILLNADVYLKEMQLMEEGGIRFMDIGKNDIKKKKSGSMIATVVMIVFMIAVGGLLIWAQMTEPLPLWIFMFILLIPVAIVVGVLLALRQRFHEIEGGEENEASKY